MEAFAGELGYSLAELVDSDAKPKRAPVAPKYRYLDRTGCYHTTAALPISSFMMDCTETAAKLRALLAAVRSNGRFGVMH